MAVAERSLVRRTPRLGKGGVDATQEKCREASFDRADGVVRSTHPIFGRFNEPPRLHPLMRLRDIILWVHPPRLFQGLFRDCALLRNVALP